MKSLLTQRLEEHQEVMRTLDSHAETFQQIASAMTEALQTGRKICFMGNGGSAADAQHLAAEIVGRFQRERAGWAAMALTTDTSVLTAVANDYGYDEVFARQVEGVCRPGDVLVGISTSGNSANIVRGIERGRELGIRTVGLTGGEGGRLAELAEMVIVVDSAKAARIQEAHIFLGHSLCEVVEEAMVSGSIRR